MKNGFHLITEILITNSSQNTTINILITLNKLTANEMFSFEMLCKQLVSRVSSGDQTLENNKGAFIIYVWGGYEDFTGGVSYFYL